MNLGPTSDQGPRHHRVTRIGTKAIFTSLTWLEEKPEIIKGNQQEPTGTAAIVRSTAGRHDHETLRCESQPQSEKRYGSG